MWESPTSKTNFLFENTKDFNQTIHGGPQDPIVFIYIISLNFNCLGSVKDGFKWSHHGHIMLFFSHVTVYAYQALEISFAKQTTSVFLSRKHTISRMN